MIRRVERRGAAEDRGPAMELLARHRDASSQLRIVAVLPSRGAKLRELPAQRRVRERGVLGRVGLVGRRQLAVGSFEPVDEVLERPQLPARGRELVARDRLADDRVHPVAQPPTAHRDIAPLAEQPIGPQHEGPIRRQALRDVAGHRVAVLNSGKAAARLRRGSAGRARRSGPAAEPT